MQKLILIRGLPGSGKSTLAKKLRKSRWKHFEADTYHMENGVYNFDISRAASAHEWCLGEATNAIEEGKTVIVSNTFTTLKELQPYLDMANDCEVPVEVIYCTGSFESIHGVPDEIIEKMADRWQDFPGEKKYNPEKEKS